MAKADQEKDLGEVGSVGMTSSAARRICALVSQEVGAIGLRLSVLGGGCSGFQYDFSLASSVDRGDTVISRDGARVVICLHSFPFLVGSILDFEETLLESQFKVINPNAQSGCGCGMSFSI